MEKALRLLLHKVKKGEIEGLAFVAIKKSGYCAGSVNIPNDDEALAVAGELMDAILGKVAFIEPIRPPLL